MITFWIPKEALSGIGDDVEIIYPQEEIVGQFTIEQIKEKLPEVEALLINRETFGKPLIDLGKKLKVIGRCGVGCEKVDYQYAGEKSIPVINTPNTVTQPTAELTIAIMLDVARLVTSLDKKTRQSKKCDPPNPFRSRATNLFGKILGIIGFGRIGKAVGEKAHGLGMKVIYSDPIRAPKDVENAIETRIVSLGELLRTSDFVTVHCPYVPENHHLINEKTLSMMKPSAFLVNASRGQMIDEAALVKALKDEVIMGAALDVYEFEPKINPELIEMDNVVLVPHIGTMSREVRTEMAREALQGMYSILKGETPHNIFNKGYLKTGR